MDLLRVPAIGPALRWRHTRTSLQCVALAVAAAIVLHGFFGPPIAPRNLATVITAVHWRGLLLVSLIALGTLFCTACPMVLARDAGRRVFHARLRWPRRLRGKWIGLVLLVLVLFAYERYHVWERPMATAWLITAYFVVAVLVDVTFAGAAFCKHVCPIGQFNFAASTMSPTTLQVRDAGVCRACATSDCIKGRHAPVAAAAAPARLVQRGCELGLFLPAKVGNLDCTMCLDCVQACPHDNIALDTRLPGAELLDTRRRSGIGLLTRRPDLAVLAAIFAFAAPISAFAMTAPAASVERWIAIRMGLPSETVALALMFALALVAAPAVLLTAAATATRAADRLQTRSFRATLFAYAPALVPLGVGVWLAHYGFHLLTGVLTVIPVTQSAAIDLAGWPVLGEPLWQLVGLRPGAIVALQIGAVLVATAGSTGLAHAISIREHPSRAGLATAPWVAVILALAATSLWILNQPMDMRGLSVG